MKQEVRPIARPLETDVVGRPAPDQTSLTMTPERLLPIAEVKSQVGFGSSYIYELIQQGRFPKPVKVGNASRWRQSEIQTWIAKQIQNSQMSSQNNCGVPA